jgi:ATP-dependent Clp protease adaptor protein ClpS
MVSTRRAAFGDDFIFPRGCRTAPDGGYWSKPALPASMAKPAASPETETVEHEELTPLYRVVLLDDNDHTYDYVIEMLQKIFIFTLELAYRHAEEVDRRGRTVLITCELPQAEYARDQIQAYGPDWRLQRSKGSMSAVVEPAA